MILLLYFQTSLKRGFMHGVNSDVSLRVRQVNIFIAHSNSIALKKPNQSWEVFYLVDSLQKMLNLVKTSVSTIECFANIRPSMPTSGFDY